MMVVYRTESGETPLELAIKKHLPGVVEMLCRKGADLTSSSGKDPPLWLALAESEDLASILVRHGVDTDGWGEGPDFCQQTLLHRAIDENNEANACFLVRSGCDLNSPRRVGQDGRGGEEAHDLATPLHLCCQFGLEATARALLEHGAHVNAKDVEGKTALHVAIENGHHALIDLLLFSASSSGLDLSVRDKMGLSPFAAAMSFKNNKAAQAILAIEPQAAELLDHRGRNFLHTAVTKNDLESVLFLISIRVNVNSRTQDSGQMTPLLLAVQVGNEMIVRNLILAGASVNARLAADNQTALHLAAGEANLPLICSILLSNEVDFAALDSHGNNALHLAVKEGNLEVAKVLLTESRIDAEAFNNKGRNPLHVLAVFGKDNSAAIFELFLQCMPEYPIDKQDSEGNTRE
jgi:ankyrin repeat protein